MRFGIVATWIALFISLFNTALFFLFNTRIHDQNYDDHISHVQRQKTKDKQAASLALLLSDFDEWAHSVPDTLSYSVQAVMPFIPVSQVADVNVCVYQIKLFSRVSSLICHHELDHHCIFKSTLSSNFHSPRIIQFVNGKSFLA